MVNTEEILAIRVISTPNPVAAIKAIRAATALSMNEIKRAIAKQAPLPIAKLYGLDHGESEQIAHLLFDELESAGIEFDIILDGEVESREYFTTAMQRWRDIGIHTEMMSDLESGEPCIETLEWFAKNSK